jgi:hyperosmotically inducible periplasmic protein
MKKPALLIAVVAASLPALAPSVVFADTTSEQATVKTTDSSIKSAIKAQFAAEKNNGFALSQIDVDVNHHGVVSLEGKVASQEAADRAVSIARATDGVHDVKNQLKIKTTND